MANTARMCGFGTCVCIVGSMGGRSRGCGAGFIIAQLSETMMQILPTSEQAAQSDVTNYFSPDVDYLMMGVIAVFIAKAFGQALFCNAMRKETYWGVRRWVRSISLHSRRTPTSLQQVRRCACFRFRLPNFRVIALST